MAAEVTYFIRALNRCHKQEDQMLRRNDTTPSGRESTALITRDLLGESFSSASKTDSSSQELDLDYLQVPAGWEKRLDLKSGKIYLQKCSPAPSQTTNSQLQDTKYSTHKRLLNVRDDTSLDLKLVSSVTPRLSSSTSCSYQSVCTLDKVKSALDRAKSEQMRRMFLPRSSKFSSQQSSTSTKAILELENEEDSKTTSFVPQQQQGLLSAAGCPNCLMYVMISKDNPKCPKCNSMVSLPEKKPRIDLNLNISVRQNKCTTSDESCVAVVILDLNAFCK